MARLDELCILNMGQSPDSSSYNEVGAGLPFFQGNADFGALHPKIRVWCNEPVKIAHPGDILISVRAPIGAMNIADRDCCIGRGLAALTVNENLCSREYIWYAISNKVDELNAKGTGSTFKAISKGVLGETEIILPPLDKQFQIAAVLDKLSNLIALRKQQLARLDKLVKAQFVEMFGTTQNNTFGYKCRTLAHVSTEFFAGGDKPEDCSPIQDNEHPFPVYANGYENFGLQGYSRSCRVTNRAVTISARGTIGYCFIREANFTPAVRLITVVPNNEISVEYLKYAIDTMQIKSSGTSQAQLIVPDFKKEIIIVPPMKEQENFVVFVEQVTQKKLTIQRSLDKLEVLKKSLMQEYFG